MDPRVCYRASDVVIGTARVALEALSYQRPLIAAGNVSYVGYLQTTILNKAWSVYFGDHHWAYPLTVERLTNDLCYVLENSTKAGRSCSELREWVTANFDIKRIAQLTLEFYEDTLEDRQLRQAAVLEKVGRKASG